MKPTQTHIAVFISLICILMSICGSAQSVLDTEVKQRAVVSTDIQLGVLLGGEILSEQFIYKPGFVAQASANRPLSPDVHLGAGVGLHLLETETIIPFFIDIKGYLSPEARSSFVGVNLGYSHASSTYYSNLAEYDYRGGLYMSAYYAVQFPVSENAQFLIAAGLVHQALRVDYEPAMSESYTEKFSMDFLTIRAGFRFK